MATNGLANSCRVPWHLLQTWVEQKQAYESDNGQPAPLTTDEEKALMPLLRLLVPARIASPVLAKGNWIGQLQERMQERGLANPTYQEEAVPVLQGTPTQYRCYVQATGLPNPVPGPDYGLGSDGVCPSFATKKRAKGYAAQCAIRYLEQTDDARRLGEAPERLQAPVSANRRDPVPPSPPSKKARITVDAPKQAQKSTAEPPRQPEAKPSSSANRLDGINSSSPSSRHHFVADPPGSFVARLSKLCQDIGKDSPGYKITPTSGGYFNGCPVFKTPPPDMPSDVGHIRDSLGKKETKERVAEAVYTFMYQDHQEHLKRVGSFMKDIDPPAEDN